MKNALPSKHTNNSAVYSMHIWYIIKQEILLLFTLHEIIHLIMYVLRSQWFAYSSKIIVLISQVLLMGNIKYWNLLPCIQDRLKWILLNLAGQIILVTLDPMTETGLLLSIKLWNLCIISFSCETLIRPNYCNIQCHSVKLLG